MACFFCHLTIEKVLKAHVVKQTKSLAPRTHNLFAFLERTELEFSEDALQFLGVLMKYQLEGRYPEFHPVPPGKDEAVSILSRAQNLLIWLKKSL